MAYLIFLPALRVTALTGCRRSRGIRPVRWLGVLLMGWSLCAVADENPDRFAAPDGATTPGIYGFNGGDDRAGRGYGPYRRGIKRFTPSTSLYADGDGVHLESQHLNGDLRTRITTDKGGGLRFTLDMTF